MRTLLFSPLLALSLGAAAQSAPAPTPPGVLTPEKLWQLGRLGEMAVSPDGRTVAYLVTRYDLAANQGNADIWTVPVAGGAARQLTRTPGSESQLNWRPDGRLTYLAAEGGSEQLYVVNADGTGQQQLSDFATG